ncbi:MAG: hypothetical protein QXK12_04910 [Candidatus Nezhaarchaeales archaeon]
MEAEVAKFRKEAQVSLLTMLILGLITLILAPLTGHYRGFYLCLSLGLIIVIASGVYLPIVRVKKVQNVKELAVPTMQSLWVSTSMGVGYVVTSLATYFKIVLPIAAVLFIIGWVMLLLGLYKLISISKRVGVPLAV